MKLVIPIAILVLLLAAGLIYFANITGNITLPNDPYYCNQTSSGVIYHASYNNPIQANPGVLCFEETSGTGKLYECDNALGSISFATKNAGETLGSWQCYSGPNGVKKWIPLSGCIFNFSNTQTTRSYSLNNSFGYSRALNGAIPTFDQRFYCLNGVQYACTWDDSNVHVKARPGVNVLSNGEIVGDYKCFNSSGGKMFFDKDAGCISDSNGNFKYGQINSIGLSETIATYPILLGGATKDNRFLCYNDQWQFCGDYGSSSFANSNVYGSVLANSWKCNNGIWETIVYNPLHVYNDYSTNMNCTCGSFCEPFAVEINTADKYLITNSLKFSVETKYNFQNGDSVSDSSIITPVTTSNNAYSPLRIKLECSNKSSLVNSVTFSVKAGVSPLNPAVSRSVKVIYPTSCTNECTVGGSKSCSEDATTVLICGQKDTDQCLDTYSDLVCSGSEICFDGECVSTSGKNDCEGNCSSIWPLMNGSIALGDCRIPSQTCFACDTNFTWNGTNCVRENANCSLNNGTCSSVQPTNGLSAESSLTCPLGNELCYVCDSSKHYNNGTCISNNCSPEMAPLGANIATGNSSFTIGPAKNWTYSYLPLDLGVCEWSCEVGFMKNGSENSCIEGKPACIDVGGACYNGTDLPAGAINASLYARCFNSAKTCLTCNGSLGVLNRSESLNDFISCIPERNCPENKPCLYENSCFKDTFRIGSLFCDAEQGEFVPQKATTESCNAHYQCENNYCSPQGKCLDLIAELNNNAGFIKKVWCFLDSGLKYGNQDWQDCMLRGVTLDD